jgi:hypothetical protein
VIIHDQGLGPVLHGRDQDYIGYHYVLWLVTEIYAAFAAEGWREGYGFLYVLKIPGAAMDLMVVVLIYAVTADLVRRFPDRAPHALVERLARLPGVGGEAATGFGLAAAAIYALNPGVVFASSYWGQLDAFPTFFMLAALWALSARRLSLAWALLTAGFVLKPQAVILYPLLAVLTLRGWGFRGAIPAAIATIGVLAGGYAYFVAAGEGETVYTIYKGIFTDDTVKISTSAYNLWWPSQIIAAPLPDAAIAGAGPFDLTFTRLSQLLTGLSGVMTLAYAWRSKSPWHAYIAASFLAFSFFMLPMKIHERYLFPFFALFAPIAVQNRAAAVLYLALSVTFIGNLLGVFQIYEPAFFTDRTLMFALTGINVVGYVAFVGSMLQGLRLSGLRRRMSQRAERKEAGVAPAS